MKKIFVLIVLLLCTSLFARDYQSPFSINRNNYIIAGDNKDQAKFQISFKYELVYYSNIYFGYTQTSWWKVYHDADTMSSNYQPEIFYRLNSKNNAFNNLDLKFIDYIQFSPFNHASTGVEGTDHRSINIYYAQTQVSYGDRVSIGDNIKVFGYYSKEETNSDIQKYKGYYENDIFLKINSRTVEDMSLAEFHFKHGGTFTKGWLCAEANMLIFTNKAQPRLFFQYFYGYGENMVNYNIKDQSARIGLIF